MTPKKLPVKDLLMMAGCILIIAAGIFGMNRLAQSKPDPREKPVQEQRLSVDTVAAEKQTIRLTVKAYGEAAPVRITDICPQVAGNIVEKHPALDQGGRVQAGEVLMKIDRADYDIEKEKADARVALAENQIRQLQTSQDRDRDRLAAVQKNTRLAKAEYTRLKTLYDTDRVGTLSDVETAEQDYNSLLDTEKALKKTIALYPLQIEEARQDLAREQAELKTAELNLARCTIPAPFSGRIRSESIELGTYITTGTTALTLADDSTLEIQVPVSDRDAFEILALRQGSDGWFSGLDQISCRIETVTGQAFATLSPRIHRAVKYDADSRTLYLAVRTQSGGSSERSDSSDSSDSVPLLDGMFCRVFLTGTSVAEAVKIPVSALNADDTVYLARNRQLKTLAVDRVMADGDDIYVSGDFRTGDRVITTRLTNPIENTALELSRDNASQVADPMKVKNPSSGDAALGGLAMGAMR